MRETLVKSEDFKDSPLGKIPTDWEVSTIGEQAFVSSGSTPSRSVAAYWQNGTIDWVKTGEVNYTVIQDSEEKITQKALNETSLTVYPVGTVILAMYGQGLTRGKVGILGSEATTNQACAAIIPKSEKLLSKYLFHYLSYQYKEIRSISHGSNQSNLNEYLIASFRIRLPPTKEQNKIAEILDKVDEAIARTESLIMKLRQMKAGLLHDLLTRGLDENGELRDAIAHPEQFKDSSLGVIPKDWEVQPLSELADVDRGKFTHRPRNDPRFYGGSYPFIQTGDIAKAAGGILTTYSQTLNERGITVSREFPVGTIAITIAANIAVSAILGIPMFLPDSVVGAIVKEPNSIRYVELCIRRAKQKLDARAPQSAQKNINLEDLRPLLIVVPEPEKQHRIAGVYEAHETRIRTEEAYRDKLKLQKKGLMHDLLTGRVRVEVKNFK